LLKHTVGNLKIALSQRIINYRGRAYDSIEQAWYSYLQKHTLYFLPNRPDQDFDAVAHEVDGFIITGGDDTPTRRTTELKLATAMMMQQKPILGICHGCFLLTDVLGGTVDTKQGHHGGVEHVVKYRDQDVVVNSYHDLVIKQPQSSAQVLAVDPEGDCEAWIDGLTAGIVWHPERSQDPWIPDEISTLFFKETT